MAALWWLLQSPGAGLVATATPVLTLAGMFFFVDNTFLLVKGNDVGERLSKIAKDNGMLLMACDKCAFDRKIYDQLVEGAVVGWFPDLHKALGGAGIDQVITL